jgi:TRAP-type C4-dicarboxylate transport system permease small subunit
MAGMAGLVSFQVFMRYALSSSLDWAEEIARLFFVWTMLLAIPHGIKAGVHVGIDLLVLQFPPGLQEILFRTMALIGSLLMLIVCVFAYVVVGQTWQELMPTVNVTSAVYYIAVLLSAGHCVLHLAILTWGGSQTWVNEADPPA